MTLGTSSYCAKFQKKTIENARKTSIHLKIHRETFDVFNTNTVRGIFMKGCKTKKDLIISFSHSVTVYLKSEK